MHVVPKPVESLLFSSDVVAVGCFRCRSDHPLFPDSGPCSYHTFGFPRTATAIRHDDGTYFVGTPNRIVFYNQGQVYFREPVAPIDATDWYVVADDVLIDAVHCYDERVEDHSHRPFPFATAPCGASVYLEQRTLFDRLDGGDPPSALAVEEAVLHILDRALGAAFGASRRESRRMRDAVEQTTSVIAANAARTPPLRDLARIAGCSPFHLSRAFRRATGQTMSAFRRSIRLRIALERLRGGAPDLTDLALDLGFASHSHFTAAFRRHFGTTPSRFRAIR